MIRPSVPSGLDLLRPRRQELGLPPNPPPLRSVQRLVLPAAALGITLVGVVMGVQGLALMREAALQRELDRWRPMELQMNRFKAETQRTQERAKTLEADTAGIAARLVSIRSGSALLEQLRRSMPETVRLQSVAVQPAQLRMKGLAQGHGATEGWQQINALMLNLEALSVVPEDGPQLQKAKAEQGGLVSFNLDVQLDPAIKPTPEQLRDLGATGLARRLLLLRQLGVSR